MVENLLYIINLVYVLVKVLVCTFMYMYVNVWQFCQVGRES